MINLGSRDPGFDASDVLTVAVPVPVNRYPTVRDRARFFDQVLERVKAVPGVTAAAGGDPLPMEGNSRQMTTEATEPNAVGEEGLRTDWFSVRPGYFATLRIRFLEGGPFDGRDGPRHRRP